MSDSLQYYQIANLMANKPRYIPPSFVSLPYISPEIYAGDIIDYSLGAYNNVYPIPVTTIDTLINGTHKGSPYTTILSDVGSSASILQSVVNQVGTASSNSIASVISALPTFDSMGLLGGNISESQDYFTNRLFSNTVFDGRGFGFPGDNGPSTSNGPIPVDSAGWPSVASQLILSAPVVTGMDGQLVAGTYYGMFKSAGQLSSITSQGSNGAVLSAVNTSNIDGVTTTFTLTASPGATVSLYFSAAISSLIIPRDGTANFTNLPLFSNTALAHYSKFSTVRLMDFCTVITDTTVTWANRAKNYDYVSKRYSWEVVIKFINAIAAYPGATLSSAWINMSGYADASYANGLSALLNSYPISPNVSITIEVGNEPWNTAYPFAVSYSSFATDEAKVVSNYGMSVNLIPQSSGSVTGNGSLITIQVTALPSFLTIGNTYSAVVYDNFSSVWSAGTLLSPVAITVASATTLTFPSTISGAMSYTDQFAVFFNLSSTLITDNTSFSVYSLRDKWYTRLVYQLQAVWKINRPQDKFILNVQTYGGTAPNGGSNIPVHFEYGKYLAGNLLWLYGVAIAPYIAYPGGITLTGNSTTDLQTVFSNLNSALSGTITDSIVSHIFTCNTYGVSPMVYEAGPDTQQLSYNNFLYQTSAATDARMGALVTSLLNIWFNNGGKEFYYFNITPEAFSNTQQGTWPSLQSFSDITSPKFSALYSFKTAPRLYSGTCGVIPGSLLPSVNYMSSGVPGGAVSASSTPMYHWYGATLYRHIDFLATVNRSRRFLCTVWGSDSVAGTVASVYIDSVLAGTATLPVNGDGSPITTIASAAVGFVVNLTSGSHNVSVRFAAGVGSNPGLYQLVFIPA